MGGLEHRRYQPKPGTDLGREEVAPRPRRPAQARRSPSQTQGDGGSHLLPRPRQSPSWRGEAQGPTSSCSLAGAGSTRPTAAGTESPDESLEVGQASFLPVCVSDCPAQTQAGLAQAGRRHAGCGGDGLCCQGRPRPGPAGASAVIHSLSPDSLSRLHGVTKPVSRFWCRGLSAQMTCLTA